MTNMSKLRLLATFCAGVLASGAAIAASLDGAQTAPAPPVIVIGFLGGFIRHDSAVRSGVQLAARLRADYPWGVYSEVFENRRGKEVHQKILRLLDTNRDGQLSPEEKQRARIIIYGTSWGGSETVTLAQALQSDGIPVLLTIQVDSVTKLGEHDGVIPANVAEAVNFYQLNGLLHGRPEIQAADPTRTRILGNFRIDYKNSPLKCENYPLRSRIFTLSHIQIECDPNVWRQIESLIRSKLPQSAGIVI
jgi:hypothetical protein